MDAQYRIQDYLQQHRISGLFEEMMGKVISDMPEEPVAYLIRILQRKWQSIERERAGRATSPSRLRRSTGDLSGQGRSTSPSRLRKSIPTTTQSSWAGATAVAKDRGYDKPWQTNSRRKPRVKLEEPEKVSTGTQQSLSKPDWDASKTSAGDFDDIWEQPQKTTASKSTWKDDDEDLLYSSHGYTGPRRTCEDYADPLAGELKVAKTTKIATTESTPFKPSERVKGPKNSSTAHKMALQQKILELKMNDSGYEDEKDFSNDDAIEIMEDADDLAREGVRNVKSSGIRISKRAVSQSVEKEAQVRVSICARCAKIMTGEPSEGNRYGQLPSFESEDYDYRSRPQSADPSVRFSPGPYSDEEFESVSQVSGPRVPVWQNGDSDSEAVTPRKGRHMFSSAAVPSKGRPMFSTETPSPSKSLLTSELAKSDKLAVTIQNSNPAPAAEAARSKAGSEEKLRKTWTPGDKSVTQSFNVSEADAQSEARQDLVGRRWNIPDDTDVSSVGISRDQDLQTRFRSRHWPLPDDTDASDVEWYNKLGNRKDPKAY